MMIVKGNKIIELSKDEFSNISKKYKNVCLDIGTGDGIFVLKMALNDPTSLWIGLEPTETLMKESSKKAKKRNLSNVLFCKGSFEIFPEEINESFDSVFINFPWGSLLKTVVQPTPDDLKKLMNIFKNDKPTEITRNLTIVFGYSISQEPGETSRLNLSDLNLEKIQSEIVPKYEEEGFKLKHLRTLQKDDIRILESSWAKRLLANEDRQIYFMDFGIIYPA